MVKTIRIANQDYNMKSSAFTMFAYRDKMGRDLLKDISSLTDIYAKIDKLPEDQKTTAWLNEITGIMELALKLAYIMIKEQTPTFKEYGEWLKDLEDLSEENMGWVPEVINLAINPMLGRIQNAQI